MRLWFGTESWAECFENPLSPNLWRSLGPDAHIEAFWRDEYLISILKTARLNSVDEDNKGLAECRPRFGRRADEIGNRGMATLDHAIAQPAHPPCLFEHGPPRKIQGHG